MRLRSRVRARNAALATAGIAVLATLACVGSAGALETVRLPTVLEIEAMGTTDGGQANSAEGDVLTRKHGELTNRSTCARNRVVTLYRGNPDNGGVEVDTATSSSRGEWTMEFSPQPITPLSNYFATVPRKERTAHGRRIICRPDKTHF